MNKKIFGILVTVLAISLMLTPLALAKPGAEKNNDKFDYFDLIVSGAGDGVFDKTVVTPPTAATPADGKTVHRRGGGWVSAGNTELTIGQETFTEVTVPFSVTYDTTFDLELLRNNDGTLKSYNIRLTDVVTVYDDGVAIGTLVLKIKSTIDFTVVPPVYAGNVVGYGTEAFDGVQISAVDIGALGGGLFQRIGTITGWPEGITNIV